MELEQFINYIPLNPSLLSQSITQTVYQTGLKSYNR